MKKIFTLLSSLLLASGFAAQAEEVTFYIEDEDDNTVAESFTTNLTQDADGNYVIEDFLNSGTPLVFSFKQPEVGGYSEISFPKLSADKNGDADVKTPEGKYAVCYLFDYKGEAAFQLKWPYVAGGEYSYVYRSDEAEEAEYGYQYYASIYTCGADASTDKWVPEFYVNFWFNGAKAEEEQPGDDVASSEITVEVTNYDDEVIAESFTTTLTKDADGNFVIGDLFNSGVPLAFNFEQPEVDGFSQMTFPGLKDEGGYAYLMTPDGNYATCYAFGYQGADVTVIKWPYVWTDSYEDEETKEIYYYSNVYRSDDSEEYKYYANITLGGSDSDGEFIDEDFYLSFWFNDPDSSTSAVSKVEADENAPVEYYNLQGVKVAEPANGIFIRKQGAKTTKVAIR